MAYEFAGELYDTESKMYSAIARDWLSAGGMNSEEFIAKIFAEYSNAVMAADCTRDWDLQGTVWFNLGYLECAFSELRAARAATKEYTDKEVLDSIHALLDGTEWSPDTLHTIADVLRMVGYSICDIPDSEEDGTAL